MIRNDTYQLAIFYDWCPADALALEHVEGIMDGHIGSD
jgi:hypothetical protein